MADRTNIKYDGKGQRRGTQIGVKTYYEREGQWEARYIPFYKHRHIPDISPPDIQQSSSLSNEN